MFVNHFSSFDTLKLFHEDPACRKLLSESLSGFADGRLPGNLGDMPEVLNTGEGEIRSRLAGDKGGGRQLATWDMPLRMFEQGFIVSPVLKPPPPCRSMSIDVPWTAVDNGWPCAGCIQRASCLPLCVGFLEHCCAEDSRLRLPWQTICEAVPMPKIRIFVDQWLLSSGEAPALEHAALGYAHVSHR